MKSLYLFILLVLSLSANSQIIYTDYYDRNNQYKGTAETYVIGMPYVAVSNNTSNNYQKDNYDEQIKKSNQENSASIENNKKEESDFYRNTLENVSKVSYLSNKYKVFICIRNFKKEELEALLDNSENNKWFYTDWFQDYVILDENNKLLGKLNMTWFDHESKHYTLYDNTGKVVVSN